MSIHLAALSIAVAVACVFFGYLATIAAVVLWLDLPEESVTPVLMLVFAITICLIGLYFVALEELRKRAKRREESL
jgi:hypothetical protein